jgi:hypothetical protein
VIRDKEIEKKNVAEKADRLKPDRKGCKMA